MQWNVTDHFGTELKFLNKLENLQKHARYEGLINTIRCFNTYASQFTTMHTIYIYNIVIMSETILF